MNYSELKVQLYRSVTDTVGQSIAFGDIGYAGNPQRKKQIEQLRNTADAAKRDELKKKLPAVTWSGTFKKRQAKELIAYTGLICLDIDKLEPSVLKLVKKRLNADAHTFLLFTSPSGNGLKVIFYHTYGPEKHLELFLQMQEYVETMYGVEVDEKCKDINRLCFLSYDEDAHLNEKVQPFTYEQKDNNKKEQPKQKGVSVQGLDKAEPKKRNSKTAVNSGIQAGSLEWVKECTDKVKSYGDGSRNEWCHQFACIANREAITEADTLNYLLTFAVDLPPAEVKATVKSVYKLKSTENGTSKRLSNKASNGDEGTKAQSGNLQGPGSREVSTGGTKPDGTEGQGKKGSERFIKFWTITEDEKGREKISLLYNELIDFLSSNGFYRMPLKDGFYQFILFKENIVKPVTPLDMKDFVFDFLKDRNERAVLEMCRRGAKNYFTIAILEGLPKKDISFSRDGENESYNFFKNGIVKVTATEIEHLQFANIDSTIWKSKIIDHALSLVTQDELLYIDDTKKDLVTKCHFAKFIWHCSHNDVDPTQAIEWEERLSRFMAHATSIGYLLHEHKNPTLTKAIIGVDNSISDKGEQDGGTGKSLFGKALAKFRKTSIIPGKEFKEDYPFKYEMVTIDSKILFYNDVRRNFDFESIFELLTDDFTFNRRNIGFLTIPFEDSPKIYIASNHTLKGQGKSFKRRQQVIEFSDFFNEDNKPNDYFGHTFFTHWDQEQWNLFYNFLIWCIQCFLIDGLVPFPGGNYEQNKLINESTTEFLDFMDDLAKNWRHEKVELLNKYREIHKDATGYNFSSASFYKWVKKYCESRGYNLNGHCDSKYDKSNGKEYYTIWERDKLEKYGDIARTLKAKGEMWNVSKLEDYQKEDVV